MCNKRQELELIQPGQAPYVFRAENVTDDEGTKRELFNVCLLYTSNHATLVLPDGIGIIYAAKILGEKLHGKVAGIEFAESLVAAMAKAVSYTHLFSQI